MSNPNPITSTAATIADQLGETAPGACATIWRTVRTLGPERTHAFVAQAQEVEANGGMLIPDGSRRRTLGGIFFYLVRT
jgi:phosphorylated adapter RNA export protein